MARVLSHSRCSGFNVGCVRGLSAAARPRTGGGSLGSALTRAISRVERCLICYLCRPRHALNGIVVMERGGVVGDGRPPWVMNRVSFGEEGLTSLANATSDVETPVGMDQPEWGRVWVTGGTIVPAPSRPGPCVPQAAQGPTEPLSHPAAGAEPRLGMAQGSGLTCWQSFENQ